jgi:hypothetical protein
MAEKFCIENGLGFMETSAKDNENVELAFKRLVQQVYMAHTHKRESKHRQGIQLHEQEGQGTTTCECWH